MRSYFEKHDVETALEFACEDVCYYAYDEGEMVVGKEAVRKCMETELQFLTVAYSVKLVNTHVIPLSEKIFSVCTDYSVSNEVDNGDVSCHMSCTGIYENEKWNIKTMHHTVRP